MNLKYSVFLGNVGHCFDRYCPAYSSPFSLEELFTRAASIPQLSAVDLVRVASLRPMQPCVTAL